MRRVLTEPRISTERRDDLLRELESHREALDARLEMMSPEHRKTLEENRELLRGAKDFLRTLEARAEYEIPSWKFSLLPGTAESDALQKYLSSKYNAFPMDPDKFPEILDKVLTEFAMTAVFRKDRVDVAGGIEFEILDDRSHPHASLMGGS